MLPLQTICLLFEQIPQFTSNEDAELKNWEPCFEAGLKQKLMHRHEGTAVAKYRDRPTWWFYNIIEFVHSILTVIQFLNMKPQWIKLLAVMLTEILLIGTASICPLQHLNLEWLYSLIFPSFPLSLPFLLLSLLSSHCSSPIVRDQSGEGLTVRVMTGWSWDPGRVRSALLVTPRERAGETRQSTPHPGVRALLQKHNEVLQYLYKSWSKITGAKTAQHAQSRSHTRSWSTHFTPLMMSGSGTWTCFTLYASFNNWSRFWKECADGHTRLNEGAVTIVLKSALVN